ncbi:MAG: chemotaxis protein CheB, partial [Cyclobacteriaceae bacterium]
MHSNENLFLVGIGSSAGGLNALQTFFKNFLFRSKNYAVIICQHLSPEHKSHLTTLLQKYDKLEISEAKHKEKIRPNVVYVTPSNHHIRIKGTDLILEEYHVKKPVPSINYLFQTMAEQLGPRAIGIILSGNGNDGVEGMREIQQAGGFAIVQDPKSASHESMPLSVIESRCYDKILWPTEMSSEIDLFIENHALISDIKKKSKLSKKEIKTTPDKIFQLLQARLGTDFSRYKPSTILRRVTKRLEQIGLTSIEEYLDYIHSHPKELDKLFQTVLIGVTDFFRDEESFDEFRKRVEKLIGKNGEDKVLRIWSVGTASGEEAYSVAIMLSEILQDEINEYDIQIFASDLDERGLKHARKGQYHSSVVEKLPKACV